MSAPLLFALTVAASWAQSGFWSAKSKETQAPVENVATTTDDSVALFPNGLPIDMGGIPDGLANVTAQGCNACHFQAHDDWSQSLHARAGQSHTFRASIERAGNSTACKQCHLPLLAQHAELAAGYIDGDLSRPKLMKNETWDATLMAEGIGCAACHVRNGTIVSTRSIEGAPHPVTASRELGSSDMCATCHQLSYPEGDRPFYDTFGEWKSTPYAAAGMQCQDCHMPPIAGIASATRFAATPNHTFAADIGRALTVLVKLDSPIIQRGQTANARVRIQNTGAGHHVPTGSPYKAYTISVSLEDMENNPITTPYTETLSRKTDTEPPYKTISDNRIPAGGEHDFTAQFEVSHNKKAGPIRLVVRVGPDGDAPILQSIPLELL